MTNTYDIETFKNQNYFIPFCVCFIFLNCKYFIYYNDADDIVLKSIEMMFDVSINKEEIIYIHNIKFDSSFIIDSISKNLIFNIECLIENKQIYSLTITLNNKKIIFRCSYKLLPLSLSLIAIGFGLNKKIDYPYDYITKDKVFWKKEIDQKYFKTINGFLVYKKYKNIKNFTIDYCLNDCIITRDFILIIWKIFKKEIDIDFFKKNILSSPSLSFYIFYKKFNIRNIPKKINTNIELFIRDSYFGGRCEVFGNPIKNDNIFHFDFSGMYGLCMEEKNIFGKSEFYYNISINSDLKPGFYNIDWDSNIEIPILPHHNIITNKLLFTNGIGNGTYWFEEINLFKEMGGTVTKINSGLIYDEYDYVFLDFVKYFNKFRKKNIIYKTLGKLMINSFYGRTGLSIRDNYSFFILKEEELNIIISLSDENKIEILNLDEINKIWFITIALNDNTIKILNNIGKKIKKQQPFNIAIASSITSKARIKLYKGFLSTIKNNGRLLYCDTDSIIASYDKDVSNHTYGEIFLNASKNDTIIKDAVFINPKTYGLILNDNSEIVKIKGVNRNYVSFEKLKNSFYNKENLTIYNMNYIKNINFKIEYRQMNKNIDLICYDKRKFTEDLKNTKSLFYENGEYR